jgi:glyoxylase-like metal-dependent hydrolase (beta-lactamase superfamily II)
MEFRVISIGSLAAHPLWDERVPVRTGHTTTTLVRAPAIGERGREVVLLVDPGLPEPALVARLRERAGLGPESVTHVFLTSFHPEARRAITAFPDAAWLVSEAEREAAGVPLAQSLGRLAETKRTLDAAGEEFPEDQRALMEVLARDVAILRRCTPAPDQIAAGVDLFPLPGFSAGSAGLLLAGRETTLICGDAIPTIEHLEQGKVLPSCADTDRARQSFQEAVEIADLLVPGRDNLLVNRTRRPF